MPVCSETVSGLFPRKLSPRSLNTVASSEQRCIFVKILTPERRIFVAGEDHVEIAFLVVAPVNQIKERPCIFLVKRTATNLVNNQTGWPYKSAEAGVRLSGASGGEQSARGRPQYY